MPSWYVQLAMVKSLAAACLFDSDVMYAFRLSERFSNI
jgi:hypothetical protein